MRRAAVHLLIPAAAAALFFAVALSPVELLGCRNRGLLALLIALGCGIAGLALAWRVRRAPRDPEAPWRAAGALILAIPLVGLLYLA